MTILRRLAVPTGDILIVQGSEGPIEMLSLGDYGKEVNLVEKPVVHTKLLPLEKKWVITISSQYGCSMGCEFCDVPKVGLGVNASFGDLCGMIITGLNLHSEVQATERLNVHFARMGEPTWNPHVLDCARWLKDHINDSHRVHPVVSTMMPKDNEWLKTFIHTWMRIKNRVYSGEAGLQLSINSTDDVIERPRMFRGNALTLPETHDIMQGIVPFGRKITLNFAVAGYTVDAEYLARLFPPEFYVCKLTPMHKTESATVREIETPGDYTKPEPYQELKGRLKDVGYEVLVFIASKEEEESRITCGHAILAEHRALYVKEKP
jgi:23S rRNA (adenine2503-C2)-methyltransferase